MGSLSKAYVHNAGTRDPAKPKTTFYSGKHRKDPNGPPERRQLLYPSGTVERFVNLHGTVVQVQLVPSGTPPTPEAIATARARMHRHKTEDGETQGFIEHGRCPLRHGTRELSDVVREEFAKMPANIQAPCSEDPVTWRRTPKGIEYFDSCPHVQWLIKERKAKHAARTEARRFKQKSVLQIEQEKLDVAKAQNEATTKILEKVADVMTKTTRKAQTE